MDEHHDANGKSLAPGDRVYCPPRLYGGPYTLAPPGDGLKTPGISGRVRRIFRGPRGDVCEIQEFNTFAMRAVPLGLVRRQYGDTQKERDLKGAKNRREAKKLSRP